MKLIWRNITRRRIQSTLTILITTITIAVFVVLLGVIQVVNKGLALSHERMGADAIIVPKDASVNEIDLIFTAIPENIYMSNNTVEQIKKVNGIEKLTPQFYCQTLALSCCEPGEEARIIGYEPNTDFIIKPYLQNEVGEDELVVGHNFKGSTSVGRNFLVLGKQFTVADVLDTTGTGMDSTVFMNINTAQDICAESEILKNNWKNSNPHDYISVIMVKLNNNVDKKTFQNQVNHLGIGVKCILTDGVILDLRNQIKTMIDIMISIWIASFVITILSLVGRFSTLAKERKKEIGLMRALGMQRKQIFKLITGEACMMALIGGILGSGVAIAFMKDILIILQETFKISESVWSINIAAKCMIDGIGLSTVVGFMSSIIPAIRSASISPQEAITSGEVI